MDQYWTLPDNKVADVKAFDFPGAATQAQLTQLAQSLTNPGAGPWPQIIAPLDASGEITIGRASRWQVVRLDTYGQTATDTLTALNAPSPDPFQDYDIIVVVAENAGRKITLNNPTLVQSMPGAVTLGDDGDFVMFMRKAARWEYMTARPIPAQGETVAQIFDGAELIIEYDASIPPIVSIALTNSYTTIYGRKTGETASTGTVQVTAAGASGYVRAVVNDNGSIFTIGMYTYSGSPTASKVAAGLKADITARYTAHEHEYSATVATDTVTITVPPNRGVGGDTIILEGYPGGGAAITVVSFAGGVDGAYQDETVDVMTGGNEGQLYMIRNGMPANIISFTTTTGTGFSFYATILPGEWIVLMFTDSEFRLIATSGQYAGQAGYGDAFISNSDSPYSIPDNVSVIIVNESSGAVTLNFPTALNLMGGREITIVNGSGTATGAITANGNGTDIEGNPTDILGAAAWDKVTYKYITVAAQWIKK